jgi:cell division protein FtsN
MNRDLEDGNSARTMIATAQREWTAPTPIVADMSSLPPPEVALSQASDYFVQVGSFANPDNAERARLDMASVGPVEVMTLSGSSGTLYRVRVGPLDDESAARTALAQAVGAGHPDARVILAHRAL